MEFLNSSNLLIAILILPLLASCMFLFFEEYKEETLQKYALTVSLVVFFLSVVLWIFYDPFQINFQAVSVLSFPFLLDISCVVGIDGISLLFILLTTFLFPFCILVNWNQIQVHVKEYLIAFLILESLLIAVFCFLDVLFFYIFFESVLIPMFLYIGIWGSRERKIYAAYLLFLYTLVGSLFMLIGILSIYYFTGTTDVNALWSTEWNFSSQCLLWLSFFASFSVKIPMFPFHIWLPEAHVEAPTAGSVLLAGVLLKLGGYGFLRFSIPLFPEATNYFSPLVYTICIIAIIYTSLTTLRQTDMKRVIAYSSVAHMNLVVLGLFSLNLPAIEGAIFLMLSHGIVSGGLFLCVGTLYANHKTRLIKYYGGLVQIMPLFTTCLFFFTLANLSLPLTSSFVGEFLILAGSFYKNIWMTILAGSTVILGACYSIWFYNRIAFGNLNLSYISYFIDISRKEFCIYFPLILFVVIAGIFPAHYFSNLHSSIHYLLYSSTYSFDNYEFFNLLIKMIN